MYAVIFKVITERRESTLFNLRASGVGEKEIFNPKELKKGVFVEKIGIQTNTE